MQADAGDMAANLLLAAQEGDERGVRAILEGFGPDAARLIDHAVTDEGWRALDLACERGHADVVSVLLDRGASPQLVGPNGFTPLMWACRGGHFDIASHLISDRRVDVNAAHASGATALAMACVQGHAEIVRRLHAAGATLNCSTHRHRWTPLHLATLYGQVEVVRLLLSLDEARELLECRSAHGTTALHIAAGRSLPGVLLLLLRHGADVHATDGSGLTPYDVAVHAGATNTAQLLESYGGAQGGPAEGGAVDGTGAGVAASAIAGAGAGGGRGEHEAEARVSSAMEERGTGPAAALASRGPPPPPARPAASAAASGGACATGSHAESAPRAAPDLLAQGGTRRGGGEGAQPLAPWAEAARARAVAAEAEAAAAAGSAQLGGRPASAEARERAGAAGGGGGGGGGAVFEGAQSLAAARLPPIRGSTTPHALPAPPAEVRDGPGSAAAGARPGAPAEPAAPSGGGEAQGAPQPRKPGSAASARQFPPRAPAGAQPTPNTQPPAAPSSSPAAPMAPGGGARDGGGGGGGGAAFTPAGPALDGAAASAARAAAELEGGAAAPKPSRHSLPPGASTGLSDVGASSGRRASSPELASLTAHVISALTLIGGVQQESKASRAAAEARCDAVEKDLAFLTTQMATVRMALGGPRDVPAITPAEWGRVQLVSRQAAALHEEMSKAHGRMESQLAEALAREVEASRLASDATARVHALESALAATDARAAQHESAAEARVNETLSRALGVLEQRAADAESQAAQRARVAEDQLEVLGRRCAALERALNEREDAVSARADERALAHARSDALVARVDALESGARALGERFEAVEASFGGVLPSLDALTARVERVADDEASHASAAARSVEELRSELGRASGTTFELVGALEARLGEEARSAAGGSDEVRRALAELSGASERATTTLSAELQALRDHADELDERVAQVGRALGALDGTLEGVSGRFGALETAVASLSAVSQMRAAGGPGGSTTDAADAAELLYARRQLHAHAHAQPQQQQQQQQHALGRGAAAAGGGAALDALTAEALPERVAALEATAELLLAEKLELQQALERARLGVRQAAADTAGGARDGGGGAIARAGARGSPGGGAQPTSLAAVAAIDGLRDDLSLLGARIGARIDELAREAAVATSLARAADKRAASAEAALVQAAGVGAGARGGAEGAEVVQLSSEDAWAAAERGLLLARATQRYTPTRARAGGSGRRTGGADGRAPGGGGGGAEEEEGESAAAGALRAIESVASRVRLLERRLELSDTGLHSLGNGHGAEHAGRDDDDGAYHSPGARRGSGGKSPPPLTGSRPMLAIAHAQLAEAHSNLALRVELLESAHDEAVRQSSMRATRAALSDAHGSPPGSGGGARGGGGVLVGAGAVPLDTALAARVSELEGAVDAVQRYVSRQQEALLEHLGSLEASFSLKLGRIAERGGGPAARSALGAGGEDEGADTPGALEPRAPGADGGVSAVHASRLSLLEHRVERAELSTSQRISALRAMVESQGAVLGDVRAKVLRQAALGARPSGAGHGLSVSTGGAGVGACGLGSCSSAVRSASGGAGDTPASSPRCAPSAHAAAAGGTDLMAAAAGAPRPSPPRAQLHASLVRAGSTLTLFERGRGAGAHELGRPVLRWVQLSADGRTLTVTDTQHRAKKLAIPTKDIAALRIGALRPWAAAAPWLHFSIELRPGTTALPSPPPTASSSPTRAAPPPIEMVTSDGAELLTWLLGLQSVVVPTNPERRLTLGLIARHRLRMIARHLAVRQGLSYKEFWATAILSAAATYESAGDEHVQQWQQQRAAASPAGPHATRLASTRRALQASFDEPARLADGAGAEPPSGRQRSAPVGSQGSPTRSAYLTSATRSAYEDDGPAE